MYKAQEYLLNPEKPNRLKVKIYGQLRTIFYNKELDAFGIMRPRCKNRGTLFSDWDSIEKIYYPDSMKSVKPKNFVDKYKKLAAKSTIKTMFIEDVLKADSSKSLYDNHITTGCSVDGEVISLNAIEKWCGSLIVKSFREALNNRADFDSGRFDFRGYDGSLWVSVINGVMEAGFNKEYRNCGNGYYYTLINDDNFIGYDVD